MTDITLVHLQRGESHPSSSDHINTSLELDTSAQHSFTTPSKSGRTILRKERQRKKYNKSFDGVIETQLEAQQKLLAHSKPRSEYGNAAAIELNKSNKCTHPGTVSSTNHTAICRTLPLPSYSDLPSLVFTMNPTRLFIASLGNPPPYSSTRHSAGHILLKALQSYLQLPPFQKTKSYANGLTSLGADTGRPELTLWQSPSLMNISGVALLKAYKSFVSTAQVSPTDPLPGLVILYDEMEITPNQLRLRRGATSAKGHNGLKSVQQSFQSAGLLDKLGDRYIKIGVGIGRPAGGSRSSDDVSQYVLGQLAGKEKQGVEDKAGELVRLLEAEMMKLSR